MRREEGREGGVKRDDTRDRTISSCEWVHPSPTQTSPSPLSPISPIVHCKKKEKERKQEETQNR